MAQVVDDGRDPALEDDHEEDEVRRGGGGGEEVDASERRALLLFDVVRATEDERGRDERAADHDDAEQHQPELQRVVRNAPAAAARVAPRLRRARPCEVLREPGETAREEAEPLQLGEAADAHRAKAGERTVSVTSRVRTATAYQ